MFRHLVVPNLRLRWKAFVGIVATLATAVTLSVATGLLLEAGITGSVAPERLAGADLIVARHQAVSERVGQGEDAETVSTGVAERLRLDPSLEAVVEAVPGVANATPDLTFPAEVVGPDGSLLPGPDDTGSFGHTWSSTAITPFTISAGRAPTAAEVVLDAGLARRAQLNVGDVAVVVAAGRPMTVTVSGIVEAPERLEHQSALFFDDATAVALHGHPGQVDVLAIEIEDGADEASVADEVRGVLSDDLVVHRGDAIGRGEFLDAIGTSTQLIAISGTLLGIVVVVATYVVAAMVGLTVHQREREVALLRAIAATPRQIRRLLTRETIVLAALGIAIGVLPGQALASMLLDGLKEHGVMPATFHADPGAVAYLAAAAAAVVIAILGARIAARRATRIQPVEALTESTNQRERIGWVRGLTGIIAGIGTIALAAVASGVSAGVAEAMSPGLLVAAVVSIGCFAPLLTRLGTHILGLLVGRLGVVGQLARTGQVTSGRRVTSAVLPLVLTIGISGMTLLQQTTLRDEAHRQSQDRVVADRVITAGAGLPADALAELDGVGVVVGTAATSIYGASDLVSFGAHAVTGGPLDAVLDLDIKEGTVAPLTDQSIAVSETLAGELGASAGDDVSLRLGDGTPVEVQISAVYRRSRGFGDAVLPWALAAGHQTDDLVERVLVRSDLPTGELDARLTEFTSRHSGADVAGPEALEAADNAQADVMAWVSYTLLGMVIVFSAFAVVNTLALSTLDRRRELALLQLVGTTRAQIRSMVTVEAATIVTIGVAIGAVVAAATAMPFSNAVTGDAIPSVPLLPCLALLGGACALGLGTMLATASLTLRHDPVVAMGVRE